MGSFRTPPLRVRGGRGELRLSKLRGQPRITPSRLRGQHFLTDKNIVTKIIAAAELAPEDVVLEVGPGLGVMTREILPRVKHLVAVELDPLFVHELKKSFSEIRFPEIRSRENGASPRLEIVEGDILQMRVSDLFTHYSLLNTHYKLVTNLPYNITSAFLKKFLLKQPLPERIVVMLQKEVAERIVVNGQRTMNNGQTNLLGLVCNLYAECSPVCKVPAAAFAPPPKVDSAVVCLKPYSDEAFLSKWAIDRNFAEDMIAFAAGFFAQPRKKMCGRLGKALAEKCKESLRAINESPDSRPAVLSIEKWMELWKKMR